MTEIIVKFLAEKSSAFLKNGNKLSEMHVHAVNSNQLIVISTEYYWSIIIETHSAVK